MAERLIVALESDIAALKAGTPGAMISIDPEIQKLTGALWPRSAEFRHPHRQGGAADAAPALSSPSPPNSAKCCNCMPAC